MTKITLKITDMTCAACAARIEKVVGRAEGVESVSVHLTLEKATVIYDPAKVTAAALIEKITKAGFGASVKSGGFADGEEERGNRRRRGFLIASAALCVVLLYIAMGPMLPFPVPMPAFLSMEHHAPVFALVQLALTIPIMIINFGFFTRGFKALRRRSPNMDSLIAVGTTAAFAYSVFGVVRIMGGDMHAAHDLYFESAGTILTLISLGKYLESRSKSKTSAAIRKLMGLAPKTARVLRGEETVELPIEQVRPGDILRVAPGEAFPVDGTILRGAGGVDESMLTGESMPVDKTPGDPVYTASVNMTGVLDIRADKLGADTALARIIRLVEDAQSSKAPIALLADRISGVFVPAVFGISIIAAAVWLITGAEPAFALRIFISILVIACPCALGLATPAALMVGMGRGAELGILFKNGEALQMAGHPSIIVLDKTGTLTRGQPTVTGLYPAEGIQDDELLLWAASAEQGSAHPLAAAIRARAAERGLALLPLDSGGALPGHGVSAQVDGHTVMLGKAGLFTEHGINISALLETAEHCAGQGQTPVYVCHDGRLLGLVAIADVLKDESPAAVAAMEAMGLEVWMLTGDNERTARAVAAKAGIHHVMADVLPQDKAGFIRQKQSEGHTVAMVGDGINDAPALAAADIGIAIGSGTDIAMESAGLVLMRGDLRDVPSALRLSRATMRNIKQNLFWAFCYNIAGIPVAAGLLYWLGGPLLNPMLGAAAMSLSSVCVVTNALRLRRFDRKRLRGL